ncbi:MAG: TonB family protein [Planctomycetes bacterium]|nr:TonB family protein [Planctomycetota bacterium]
MLSGLLHAAALAALWGTSWQLAVPPEPPSVAAKSRFVASERDAEPLPEPVALPPVEIDPPAAEARPDPVADEEPLEEPVAEVRAPRPLDPLAPLAAPPPAIERLPAARPPPRPALPPAPLEAVPPPATEPPPLAPAPAAPTPPPPAEVASDPLELSEATTDFAPQPVYPARAIELRLEGTATLLALVKADGRVEACEVETSSGHPLLDEAARAALKRWRFKPRLVDGRARPFTARVPFHFFIPKRN